MLVDSENNISTGMERLLADKYEVIILECPSAGDRRRLYDSCPERDSAVLKGRSDRSADDVVDVLNQYSNVVVENFIQKPINRERLLNIINNKR